MKISWIGAVGSRLHFLLAFGHIFNAHARKEATTFGHDIEVWRPSISYSWWRQKFKMHTLSRLVVLHAYVVGLGLLELDGCMNMSGKVQKR